ncbi:helicase SRCAP-like isoform X2 [Asterias rubens]|uniref:helicase SRCAP-like isoform X2 n=1 Tax=Asterias rubens TaxID=7604 RepID=UPI0014555BE5|nr:helicase SRCAP-like isoform X2 [Asterias rubens]
MQRGSSDDSQSGVYHKLGSPPQQPQPQQQQTTQRSIDLSQGLPSHSSGYAVPQHTLQQYLINPVAGVQGAQVVASSRPIQTSPIRVPAQHAQVSPSAVVLQQQQQQQNHQDVARQQAFMQLASLRTQLIAGTSNQVINLQLSPGFVDPSTGLSMQQMSVNTPPTSIGTTNPYVFHNTPKLFSLGEEPQISQEQIQLQSLLLPSHHQPVGTIHHHGQGSPRSTMPPLSSSGLNFGAARRMSSHSPTRGAPDRKSPTAGGGAYHRSLSSPARTNPIPSSPSRMRKSPLMASETDHPPATNEVAELRTRLLEHKLKTLHDLQEGYKERLIELFFLENGHNMMDFIAWKKRPSPTLHNYMMNHKLEGREEEITINDEVKVITNSGSTRPLSTPVAISTQLPPAVSALSSQIKAKELRKSFPGALPTASPDMDRKRTYSQAGLDSSNTPERKPLGFPSSHEPNVTLSQKTIIPIPALPGSQPSPLYKQHKQLAAGQHQHHGTSNRSQIAAAVASSSTMRTSLGVPHVRREPKSPPTAKHSLHQLKAPTNKPLTVNTTASTEVTSTAPVGGSLSPRRHSSGSATGTPPIKLPKSPISPNAHQRLATRQHSLSAVYDYTIGSQEMIVERAKQEAQVMQRIAELRKEGLWSARRLPKVQEPPRHKTHWEYLLEEAQWLATDFIQERRWKKAAARKLVRAVARFHQEKHTKEVKAEREETQKLRRIAGNIAKEIKTFWSNIEKVVQYKQQSRLDDRRRKAMDMQLDYIVGQTEKYSSWLTEGLNLNAAGSAQGSVASSPRSDPSVATPGDDVDFQPEGDESDDEETIDVEEREAEDDQDAHKKELELLQKESEVPLEDLIGSLPPEILEDGKEEKKEESKDGEKTEEKVKKQEEEEPGLSEVTKEVEEESKEKSSSADEEFVPSTDDEDEEMPDDEETLQEQEETEGTTDHTAEVAELQAEGEMTMEELLKKYSGAYDDDFEMPLSEEEEEEDEGEQEDEETEEEEEDLGTDDEESELTDIGMEYLINPDKENEKSAGAVTPAAASQANPQDPGPNKEITDIAAAAQSLQPTGYTLSTTQVKTPVPFLLRHKLREYQHIGLDWLVTMHDKRLNGILADEMGLGKTIQTIALLAHMACGLGNWGPHLIVVPTSVMLNWELEFKKWCPGFKILTYFGSQKERKLKRQGWTKSNAFHVCITSYKLVIQDHQSFRRKKWKYLVLDEAQNIKNFKSQRWQTLLNFNSQRRLLLTGTPLQNNLMELWSLMHFLMPHVFASHREFREWFSNPLSGMIEGTQEYNEGLIRRLHKVLRPFLLRRLKCEVEKQLPQKYEHVVRCRLSKRQRFLYDDFMSQAKTRETLSSGHFMSVINVLMQLRKVCNHPDLFESRPIQSPFKMEGIRYYTASLITKALEHDPHKNVSLNALRMCIANLEMILPAYAAHRIKQLQTPRPLIEEIDSAPDPPPRPQPMKFKPGKLFPPPASAVSQAQKDSAATVPTERVSPVPAEQSKASPVVVSQPMKTAVTTTAGQSTPTVSHVLVRSAAGIQMLRTTSTPTQGRSSPSVSLAVVNSTPSSTGMPSLTLVSHPVVPSSTPLQQLPGYTGIVSSAGTSPGQQRFYLQQQTSGAGRGQFVTTQPITVQLQGGSGTQTTKIALPASQIRQMSQSGIVQIVQTPSGHQILRPAVRFTSPSTTQQQQQQNPSRSSPVPIQMTLQATSPQIPGSILNQGSVTTSQTSLAQSQAQTVIQALAQAVTQASSAGQATSTFSSQQLQSVLAQLQRQQLQQQQRKLQQQQQQQMAVQSQATSTATISSTTQSIKLTPQQITKPIASVAPMVNVTLSQVGGIKPVLAPTVVQPKPQTPSLQMPTPQKPDTPKERIQEGIAKTTTVPCSAVTSPPPLVAIRPHYSAPQVNPKAIPSPTMQPVLKIRPLSNVSIAKATGGPKVSVTTAGSRPAVKASNLRKKAQKDKDSPFFLESLHQDGIKERKSTLARLANLNHIRCNTKPAYGSDLRSAVSIFNSSHPAGEERPFASCTGLFHCQGIHGLPFPYNTEARISQTSTLRSLVKTPEVIIDDLKEIIKRYVMMVPMATSPPITMHVSHPAPSVLHQQKVLSETMRKELTPRLSCLHPIQSGMVMHFPELRLIQYDCGKLQSLDFLLRKLKLGSHRVLIFTQMTRMLDVLESFLNYHGHIYVRLDGTTKVEQRQVLMDRFNMDKRIFCFILSTRSGGLGINLTGADTVVFYDSDWNPTMDAQAQDRCHRIGQTRDVHIYRLISEMTVEENILKKANQKRLLVDVSIEGGNFTTAFFKTNTITDIFNLSNRREAEPVLIEEMDIPTGKEPKVAKPEKAVEPEKADKPEQAAAAEAQAVMTQNQLEQALAKTEDETDVKATSKALAEQDADLAEFDETIPYEGEEGTKSKDDVSKVEIELAQLDNQLTNIEKYAMKYLESTLEPIAMDEMLEAEEQVELAKKEWELERLQALKEAEERKAELEEDEIFFTYTNEESKNKVHKSRSKQGGGNKSKSNSQKSSRANSRSSSKERTARQSQTAPGRSTRRNPKADAIDDSGPRSPVTRSVGTKSPPPIPPTASLSPKSPLARLAPAKLPSKRAEKTPKSKKSSAKEGGKAKEPKTSKASKRKAEAAAAAVENQLQEVIVDGVERSCNSPMDLSLTGPSSRLPVSSHSRVVCNPQGVLMNVHPSGAMSPTINIPVAHSSVGNHDSVQPLNLSPRGNQPLLLRQADLPPVPDLVSRLAADVHSSHLQTPKLPAVPLLIPGHPMSSIYSTTSPPPNPTNQITSVVQSNLEALRKQHPSLSSASLRPLTTAQLLALNRAQPNVAPRHLLQQGIQGVSSPRPRMPNQSQTLPNPPPLQSTQFQRHPQPISTQAALLQQHYQLKGQSRPQVASHMQNLQSQYYQNEQALLKLQGGSQASLQQGSPNQTQSQSQMPILARLQMLTRPGLGPQVQQPALRLSLATHPTQGQGLVHQQPLGTAQLLGAQGQPRQKGQPILARFELLPAGPSQPRNRFNTQVIPQLQLHTVPHRHPAQPQLPVHRHPLRAPTINAQALLQLQSQKQAVRQTAGKPQTIAQALAKSVSVPRASAPSQVIGSLVPSQPTRAQVASTVGNQPQVSRQIPQTVTSQPQVSGSGILRPPVPGSLVARHPQSAGSHISLPPRVVHTSLSPSQRFNAPSQPIGHSSSEIPFTVSLSPKLQMPILSQAAVRPPPTTVSEPLVEHKEIRPIPLLELAHDVSHGLVVDKTSDQVEPQIAMDVQRSETAVQALVARKVHIDAAGVPREANPVLSLNSQPVQQDKTPVRLPSQSLSEQMSPEMQVELLLNLQTTGVIKTQAGGAHTLSQVSPQAPILQAESKFHGHTEPIQVQVTSNPESEKNALEDLKLILEKGTTPSTQTEIPKPFLGEQAPNESSIPLIYSSPQSYPTKRSPNPTHSPPSTQSSPNTRSPPLPALSDSPEPLDLSPTLQQKNSLVTTNQGLHLDPVNTTAESIPLVNSAPKSENNGQRNLFENLQSPLLAAPEYKTPQAVMGERSINDVLTNTNQPQGNINSEYSAQSSTKPGSSSPEQRNIFKLFSSMMKSPGPKSTSPTASPPSEPLPSEPLPSNVLVPSSPTALDLAISKSLTIPSQTPENSKSNSNLVVVPAANDGPVQPLTPVENYTDASSSDGATSESTKVPTPQQLAKTALKQKLAKIHQLPVVDKTAGPRTRAKSGAELADSLIRTRSRGRHHSASPSLSVRDLINLSRGSSRSSSRENSRDVSPARGGGTPSQTDNTPKVKRGRGRPRKNPVPS